MPLEINNPRKFGCILISYAPRLVLEWAILGAIIPNLVERFYRGFIRKCVVQPLVSEAFSDR